MAGQYVTVESSLQRTSVRFCLTVKMSRARPEISARRFHLRVRRRQLMRFAPISPAQPAPGPSCCPTSPQERCELRADAVEDDDARPNGQARRGQASAVRSRSCCARAEAEPDLGGYSCTTALAEAVAAALMAASGRRENRRSYCEARA